MVLNRLYAELPRRTDSCSRGEHAYGETGSIVTRIYLNGVG